MKFTILMITLALNTIGIVTHAKDYKTMDVIFPTLDVAGYPDLYVGSKTPNTKGIGRLYLPNGASKKTPAYIVFHGSGGAWDGHADVHGEFLAKNGITALVVDVYKSRKQFKTQGYTDRIRQTGTADYISDGIAALNWLAKSGFANPKNINVTGYSAGGITSVMLGAKNVLKSGLGTKFSFQNSISMYGLCISFPKNHNFKDSNIYLLFGEKDESSPKKQCDEFEKNLQRQGASVKSYWYPNAAHSWLSKKRRTKFVADAPNFGHCRFNIKPDGQVSEQNSGLVLHTDEQKMEVSKKCLKSGYTLGYNKSVSLSSMQLTVDIVK